MKTAYITFHVPNYGIGFTKNILGAFYSGKLSWDNIDTNYLDQKELENTFLQENNHSNKIVFDKVFYLHVKQSTINKVTSTRLYKEKDCWHKVEEDQEMKTALKVFERLYLKRPGPINLNKNELDEEIEIIETEFSSLKLKTMKLFWRVIHYYNIKDQLKWFFDYSNSRKVYTQTNFESIDLEERYKLNDLRDHKKIALAIQSFIKDKAIIESYDKIVINVSNVGYEIQVVWFALAQAGWFPDKVHFISTYDKKDQDIRFKDFTIREVSKKVIEEISEQVRIYDSEPTSDKRKIAEKELRQYINKGFSILILGERGVGKTKLINEISQVPNNKFRSISAAAYDDDTRLEAELFGYVPGAYTGAKKGGSEGLFHIVSHGGILLIDELHAMSRRVQEKLMASLSTNSKGEFEFRKLGGDETETAKFTIIFASNRSIDDLKYKYLLPDFYDRVVQYIIYIPPLKEVREDIESDWEKTWNHQKFNTKMKCPKNKELFSFLKTLDFPGNWRDIQRIAIWYEAFLNFDSEHKKIIGFNSPVDYVKGQYENICLRQDTTDAEFEFSTELTANGQVDYYMKHLALWAKDMFGSFKKAAEHFNGKGDDIAEKTLYNWANPEKKNR